MTGQVTSLGLARYAPAEWRSFATFLRRPALPERPTGPSFGALGKTLRLFALDLALMAVIVGAIALASALGVKLPSSALEGLELGPLLLLAIVVAAPLAEEIVFRGWLSGRAGHVAAVVALIAGVAVPVFSGPAAHPVLLLGGMFAGLALAIALLVWLRKRPPMPFFSRHFAWFYAVSAVLFALAHLSNYSQGEAVLLLPLVVPQLLAGLIFGYARVTYGLWSDMLLHMMHNGVFISLVVFSTSG